MSLAEVKSQLQLSVFIPCVRACAIAIRCSSPAHRRRPSPCARDCWNTRRSPVFLRWRPARTPSLMSCASPTPACLAGGNCRFSSTSAPSVSSRARTTASQTRWSVFHAPCPVSPQSCPSSRSWIQHSFLLTLVHRRRLPHMVCAGTYTHPTHNTTHFLQSGHLSFPP